MTHARRRLLTITAALGLLATVLAPPAAATGPETIATGLHNPRGIAVGANGRIFVAEASAGRISVIDHGVRSTYVGGLPSATTPEGDVSGPVNVDLRADGNLVAAIGAGPQAVDSRFDSVLRLSPGHSRVLADVQAYRDARPEPVCSGNPVAWCDLDEPPNPTDSNAYGIAAIDAAHTLVTDAAGNDLLLVGPHGSTTTVARFPNELVGTSHLPPFLGIPADIQIPAEPVPTSVAIGPDGYWYVGELKGFPFTPGASRVWRVAPWARNVTCDASATTGPCTVYADGFTSIIDLDFGPDGALYVAEMVHDGVGNLFFGTGSTAGAVWRVHGGTRTELTSAQLDLIGGLAVARDGSVYVTTGDVTDNGSVVRIR